MNAKSSYKSSKPPGRSKYYQCLTKDLRRPDGLSKIGTTAQTTSLRRPSPTSTNNLLGHTLGLLVQDVIYQMHTSCQNARSSSLQAGPIVSFFTAAPFQAYVELHRQDDLPPITTSLPSQSSKRGWIRPHQTPQKHRLRQPYYTSYTQPRPRWLLH